MYKSKAMLYLYGKNPTAHFENTTYRSMLDKIEQVVVDVAERVDVDVEVQTNVSEEKKARVR